MPCLCLARIYSNKACRVRTLPLPGRALPLLHTNGLPQDNCPGLRIVLPTLTVPLAAPVGPLWHTTCALLHYLCSRQCPHRAPWPNEVAPLHFPVLQPSGSTRLLSLDLPQR